MRVAAVEYGRDAVGSRTFGMVCGARRLFGWRRAEMTVQGEFFAADANACRETPV